jgi:hypothetical protein
MTLDGKTSRGSKGCANQKAIHLVNAFVNELQMVWGQVATDQKPNEITAIWAARHTRLRDGIIQGG